MSGWTLEEIQFGVQASGACLCLCQLCENILLEFTFVYKHTAYLYLYVQLVSESNSRVN